jgi:hypothetical protein
VGWGYDADGRNTTVETRTNSYDAAGRQVSMTGQQWIFNHYTPVSQTSGYDGDGNKVQVGAGAAATYYLQSSALGGVLVAELSNSGQKNVGYVYVPGGELLAEQVANAVTWRHVTPAGTGKYDTYSNLSYFGRVEFDPSGADINLTGPPTPDTGGGDGDVGTNHFGGLMSRLTSDFFNTANDCMVRGHRESCSVAMFYVNMGTGRKDFTKDSSTTMDDMGKALGVVFTPTGLSPNSLMTSAIEGTADFTYNVMGWAEDPATKIKYWVPIPTYFIGIPAAAGSAIVLIGALALLRPQNPTASSTPTQPTPIWCQPDVIKAMNKAWGLSGNAGQTHPGSQPIEAGFNLNGTPSNYKVSSSFTNQVGKMTIHYNNLGRSDPTFANFHIHPKGFDQPNGYPSTPENNHDNNGKGDTGAFDDIYATTQQTPQGFKYQGIQVYVMSWQGLSMYDPVTKKATQLVKGTGFLKGEGCPR